MKFRRAAEKEPTKRTGSSHTVNRPEPYRYHAVRSNTERQTQRGKQPKSSSRTSTTSLLERLMTFAVISVIAGSILYVFWLDVAPNVRTVDRVEGSSSVLLREVNAYESGAQELLSESVLSRTKLTINTKEFSHKFQERFPELASVTVTIPLSGHKPVIDIQAKQPALLLINNGQSFVIGQTGVAVVLLSDLPQIAQEQLGKLPRIKDESRVQVVAGSKIMTTETVEFLMQLNNQYAAADLLAVDITLPANKPNEVRITTSGESYYIKYLISRPANEQFGAYRALVEKLAAQSSAPVSYIDVRVEGKVFYK